MTTYCRVSGCDATSASWGQWYRHYLLTHYTPPPSDANVRAAATAEQPARRRPAPRPVNPGDAPMPEAPMPTLTGASL